MDEHENENTGALPTIDDALDVGRAARRAVTELEAHADYEIGEIHARVEQLDLNVSILALSVLALAVAVYLSGRTPA